MANEVASLYASLKLRDEMTGGLRRAEGEIHRAGGGIERGLGGAGRAAMGLQGAMVALGGVGVVAGIANLGKEAVSLSIAWETAFTGVVKTLDATSEQLEMVEGQLLSMAKTGPTAGLENAAIQLAGIAEVAGQLGVGADDIAKFTETIAMLAMTTNIVGEEGALSLAQFANIMQMPLENIDRLGSVIADLGNNLATTERDILEMSQRLAGAGSLANLTEAEVIALAGAMSSLGINAEAGGTAMSRVLNDMTKAVAKGGEELGAFAHVAGVAPQAFAAAWKNDPMVAIQWFLAGLGDMSEGARLAALEMLKLNDVRVTDTLLRMSGNTDLLTEALKSANTAWDENTALMDEANLRFNTTDAQMNRLKNNMKDFGLGIGDALKPAVDDALFSLNTLFDVGNLFAGAPSASEIRDGLKAEMGMTEETITETVPIAITFQAGDNVWKLSQEFGLDQAELLAALQAADIDPNGIPIGTQILLTTEGVRVVTPEDAGAYFGIGEMLLRELDITDGNLAVPISVELNAGDDVSVLMEKADISEDLARGFFESAGFDPDEPIAFDVTLGINVQDHQLTIDTTTMREGIAADITAQLTQEDIAAAIATSVFVSAWNFLPGEDLNQESTMKVQEVISDFFKDTVVTLSILTEVVPEVTLGEITQAYDFAQGFGSALGINLPNRDRGGAAAVPEIAPLVIEESISVTADAAATQYIDMLDEMRQAAITIAIDTGEIPEDMLQFFTHKEQQILDYALSENLITDFGAAYDAFVELKDMSESPLVMAMTYEEAIEEFENRMAAATEARSVAIDVHVNIVRGGGLMAAAAQAAGGLVLDALDGARAGGGPVSPFGTYLVGEQGPELLEMGGMGGVVHPNSALGGGFGDGGGGETNITINIETFVSSAVNGQELLDELIELTNSRSSGTRFVLTNG